ncbi:FadR/GntR family transcriptional regulator [Streptomyces sp. NPDC058424]|uniref:FadR/GntR family transcriptional regulator n=1 Tax=Streptomyces sp. NPDC058424 TaxID=3346491 RepID=UPI00364EF650
MTELWTPVQQPGSLATRIAAQIEQLIVGEQLKPGDRLPPERELATLLGVSRPSLREAVRSLAAQGRVSVRHGQGVFVESDATTRRLRSDLAQVEVDFTELFAMREVLEVPAAGWAATNASPEQLAAIEHAFAELQEATSKEPVDWPELQRLDVAFHESVVKACGNRFLLRTLGVLNEVMVAGMQTTLQIPGRLERSAADHARILEAVRRGDATGARAATRAHIRAAQAAGLKHRKNESATD